MNGANLHLAINHLPLFGIVIGLLVLFVGYYLKNTTVRNVAFGIFIIAAIGTLPSYFSGDAAKHVIEDSPGFDRAYVQEHAKAALWGMIFIQLVGVVSIVLLFLAKSNHSLYKPVSLFALGLALFTLVVMARVTHSGGEVTHPEVRGLFGMKPPPVVEGADEDSDE